jgi:hypothetical protein
MVTYRITGSWEKAVIVGFSAAAVTYVIVPIMAAWTESMLLAAGASATDLAGAWFLEQVVLVNASKHLLTTAIIGEAAFYLATRYPVLYQQLAEFTAFVSQNPDVVNDIESVVDGFKELADKIKQLSNKKTNP